MPPPQVPITSSYKYLHVSLSSSTHLHILGNKQKYLNCQYFFEIKELTYRSDKSDFDFGTLIRTFVGKTKVICVKCLKILSGRKY